MTKSTRTRSTSKPKKPYPDFPLFPHAAGVWAKKIRGRLHYFGVWSDPAAALQKYLDQRDDLHAGRIPRAKGDSLTVRELLNRYLTTKQALVDSSEILEATFDEYHRTCERIVNTFGRDRLVDDLRTDDFERLRKDISRDWGGSSPRQRDPAGPVRVHIWL